MNCGDQETQRFDSHRAAVTETDKKKLRYTVD